MLLLTAALTVAGVRAAERPADAWLNEAVAALDGATTNAERRGAPAKALQLIGRAEAVAVASELPAILALKARAAALGGDYGAAGRYATAALKLRQAPESVRTELTSELEVWRMLQLAQAPTSFLYDEEIRIRRHDPPFLHEIRFAPGPTAPAPTGVSPRALGQVMISDATLALAPRTNVALLDTLLTAFTGQISPACVGSETCFWDQFLRCELLLAAGRAGPAGQCWRDLAASVEATDPTNAGLALVRAGDAATAPHSGPLELNLAVVNPTPANLAMNAGLRVVEFEPVSKEDLKTGREAYDAADELFGASCRRCRIDVEARRAYLLFAANRPREAMEGFAAAARDYAQEGDLLEQERAQAATAAVALIAADEPRARKAVESLSAELASREAVGPAIGACRLFARIGARLEYVDHEVRRAERAFDLALSVADALSLSQVGAALRTAKAELLSRVGRRHEALLLRAAARRARHQYLDVIPSLSILRTPQERESEVLSYRQVLLDQSFTDEAAFFADGDVAGARAANEEVRQLVHLGVTAMIGLDLGELAEANEVHLLLAERRLDEARVAAAKLHDPLLTAMVHLYAGEKADAAKIARALADRELAELPSLSGATEGASVLRLQSARALLARSVGILTMADAPAEAGELLRRIDGVWKDKAGALSGRQWLYSDSGAPWTLDVTEGDIEEGLGDYAGAEARYAVAAQSIARASATLEDSWQREGFDTNLAAVDRARVRILLEENRFADALLQLEATRARIFQRQLIAAGQLSSIPGADTLLRRWWRVEAQLESLRRQAIAGASADEIPKVEALAASLRAELRRVAPAFDTSLGDGGGLDRDLVDRAQRAMTSATVLVAYFFSGEFGGAWVLRPSGPVAFRRLPVAGPRLREMIADLYNRLATPQEGWEEPARALYDALLRPIADLLPSGETRSRIGIVPHSGLNLVPFGALLDGERALIERADLFYAPSLRALVYAARAARRPIFEHVVAFGLDANGLVQAESEARAVAGRQAVVGGQVTRRRVLAAAQAASALHLATHAMQDERNPFLSHVALADGALTIEDILNVSWKPSLVTLSACETALGELTSAEEFTGISRALLAAGVSTVALSSWKVDDAATARLMKRFYARLRAKEDAVLALNAAQRDVWASRTEVSHPAFWASFSLVGADR